MELTNRTAIVTGGASGIGLATAQELARQGAAVVALVDQSDALEVAAQQVRSVQPVVRTPTFRGDVTSSAFRREVFDTLIRDHGAPTVLVPAAGITRDGLAVKVDKQTGVPSIYAEDTFRLVLEVNLTAPTYWALELVARLAQQRAQQQRGKWQPTEGVQGTVIFIGSVSAQGNKGQIAYAATKAALTGVAATLTKEAMYHGIRCGVVHPGFTDTPMVRKLGAEFLDAQILPHTQLGRLIEPAEIARAICFMIRNPAVSGQLWVDAGWHAPA